MAGFRSFLQMGILIPCKTGVCQALFTEGMGLTNHSAFIPACSCVDPCLGLARFLGSLGQLRALRRVEVVEPSGPCYRPLYTPLAPQSVMAGLCAPGILPAAVIQLFIRRPAVFLLPYRPPFRGYKQPDSTARNSLRGLSGCGMRLWPAP